MAERETTFTLTKTEALALERVAEIGIRIARELNLIQSLETAERAKRKVAQGRDIEGPRPPARTSVSARPARQPGRA